MDLSPLFARSPWTDDPGLTGFRDYHEMMGQRLPLFGLGPAQG